MPSCGLEQHLLRHEADQLAPRRRHPAGLGLQPHHVVGPVQGGLVGVDQVHRHLSLTVDLQSETLDVPQTTARPTNRLRDILRHLQVLRTSEVHVVRDEERSRTDDRRAGGRVNGAWTEVRVAGGVGADLGAGELEPTAADVDQVRPFRAGRRPLVEVDGDAELVADPASECLGERDAVVHRGALQRNERADVRRTDARVLTLVRGEVDELLRLGDAAESGLDGHVGRCDERDDRPVVAGVRRHIEDRDPRCGRDRVPDGVDDLGAATLGEVGDALDESHALETTAGGQARYSGTGSGSDIRVRWVR